MRKTVWWKPFIVLDEIERVKAILPDVYEAALYQHGTSQHVKNQMARGRLAYGRYRTLSYDETTWKNLKGYKTVKVNDGDIY